MGDQADAVVVGSGCGLATAMHAQRAGIPYSSRKAKADEGSTRWAQGRNRGGLV